MKDDASGWLLASPAFAGERRRAESRSETKDCVNHQWPHLPSSGASDGGQHGVNRHGAAKMLYWLDLPQY